jgi:uncharacterized DUF497 family protein
MTFEWDARKAAQNAAKHGVPFEYAARVFLDPQRLDAVDERRDYGEERRLYVIAYTPRSGIIRLISARKANERERRQHDEALSA